MKNLVILFALTLISRSAFSQADFRPGYVINLNKDTVQGFIFYSEGNQKFTRCYFKTTLQQPEVKYTPADIMGYRLEGDSYFSVRSVKMNLETKEQFFAEILVQGRATLFKILDRFYLEDSQQNIFPLEQTSREVVQDNKRFLRTDRKYLGILSWKFSDCEKMKRQINDIKLHEQELTVAFEKYNSCFSQQTTSFKDQKPWTRHAVGIASGVMFTTLNIDGLASFIDSEQFKHDTGMLIGLRYTLSSPRISEKVSMNLGLTFQKVNHKSDMRTSGTRDVVSMQYNALRIPVSVVYNFSGLNRRLTPFLEGGIAFLFYLNLKSYWQREQVINNAFIVNRVDNFFYYQKNNARAFLGLGATYKWNDQFDVSFRGQYYYGSSHILAGVPQMIEQNITVEGAIYYKLGNKKN